MNNEHVNQLILQALEHEQGGIEVYEMALTCVVNEELQEEWEKYLEQTRNHEQVLLGVCESLGLDAAAATPGRKIVAHVGKALVKAMQMAREAGDPVAAELVACECVVMAETKDHLNWELLGKCAEKSTGARAESLEAAVDEVEEQEDEHLYHSKGWCRELWIKSLGMKAVLPPPEERKHVKTAIGAARAEQASDRSR